MFLAPTRGSHLLGIPYCLLFFFNLYADDVSVASVADRLEERLIATRSGTFRFEWEGLKIEGGKLPDTRPFAWDTPPTISEITFAGDEFIERYPGYSGVSLRRSQFSADFYKTDKDTPKEVKRLELKPSALVPFSEQIEHQFSFGVFKAGTIRSQGIVNFLRRNPQLVSIESAEIGDTGDAEPLLRLCVNVDADRAKEIECYHRLVKSARQVTLRIEVLPSRGYIVRKMEYRADDGTLLEAYESSDVRPCPGGIWFPYRYYTIFNNHHVESFYIKQFLVSEISRLNEPIPEASFTLDVPAGTIVNDWRGDRDEVFVAEKDFQLVDPDDRLTVRSLLPPVPEHAQRKSSIFLWLNVIIIFGIVLIMLLRARSNLGRA